MIQTPQALAIATAAHAGQTDKAGTDYILHPLAVSKAVESFGNAAITVALLHDVIEDSAWTREDLISVGISELSASFVQALTRGSALADHNARATMDDPRQDPTYMDYVRGIVAYSARVKDDTPALVKYADNRHNFLRQDANTGSLPKRYKAAGAILRDFIGDARADVIETAINNLLES